MRFTDSAVADQASWQAYERLVMRLVLAGGWDYSRLVGQSGDGGADVIAGRNGRKWLFQVKKRQAPAGIPVLQEAVEAARRYAADVPVVVSKAGFTQPAIEWNRRNGVNVQLWSTRDVQARGQHLPLTAPIMRAERWDLRGYQNEAVEAVVGSWLNGRSGRALIVLATGLGKTVIAGDAIRRMTAHKPELRVLLLAHTVPLIVQLDQALWPFLSPAQKTVISRGSDPVPSDRLSQFEVIIATRQHLLSRLRDGDPAPDVDLVIVDECHHGPADSYVELLSRLSAGESDGPFLLGMTATPWRSDNRSVEDLFGRPLISIDLVRGLKSGYLANLEYRVFTDQIDWEAMRAHHGEHLKTAQINEIMFSNEWNDAQVERIAEAWREIQATGAVPRALVFCRTVAQARQMAGRINAFGFAHAEAIYGSSYGGASMSDVERNLRLWDFYNGGIGVLCSVDVLNEGVDVPDVNLVAFARVTHSRLIFIQQLGRGLRVAQGKERLIALDFVTDVRRFAALLRVDKELALDEVAVRPGTAPHQPGSRVTFLRRDRQDDEAKTFLELWLEHPEEIEGAKDDESVLHFPPSGDLPRA